jgi:uncharacterized iron-regulated protein
LGPQARVVPLMRSVMVACLLCLGVTAGSASEPNWGTWAAEVSKVHPLAGSFYSPRLDEETIARIKKRQSDEAREGKAFLSVEFREAVRFNSGLQDNKTGEGWLYRPRPSDSSAQLDFVGGTLPILLLGEVHDNPMHHQLRAWLIAQKPVCTFGCKPASEAVVFEQIRADQQPALDRFKALAEAGGGTAEDLFRLLEWDKSGWPPAAIYKPLIETVVAAKIPIFAGNLPPERMRAVARGGPIPPEERARLKLDSQMPAALAEALDRELADSHCGVMPPKAIGGLAAAQRYRDAYLADALLTAQKRHGFAILIAGNGHVRSDRGVPWYIRERAPATLVTSVVILEVEEGKTDPEAYVPRDPKGNAAADLVIFTPRAERGDPCEAMRKMKR